LRKSLIVASTALCGALALGAQAPDRIATTADALLANPIFFDGKRIVVRHALRHTDRLTQLDATVKPVYVLWRDPPVGSDGEIRGEFRDLGRMQDGDSRFSSYDFHPIIDAANNGRWPGREQIFVILGATFVAGQAGSVPTLRTIALTPAQFENRTVTLVGRFKGRNLYGDLPQGVAKSKWDFVLQSADAAIWVTALRPKGKDFDLDPGARVDTGKWLEVKGTVQRDGPSVWIAGEWLRLATAPAEVPVEIREPAPQEPAPAVIFSAPLTGETDFPVDGRVRVQFSRDMIGASFRDHVRIRYAGTNAPSTAPPSFALTYSDATRAIEIRFKTPLVPFQVLVIELDAGITAIDGQPLRPWTLRFTTGQ
jgi:hypothetical protein